MKGYVANIEALSIENTNFRKVLYTTHNSQLVLMSLLPGEEIGMEVHNDNDQFFRVDEGEGKVIINGIEYAIADGSAIVIPKGTMHNVMNTGTESMKLYTLYMPPHHKDGTVHETKEYAESHEEEFDGITSD
jgi:mannose-6-phosphate isomerase-like protein (cupin superfamily)